MIITESLKNNLVGFQNNIWNGYINPETGEVFLELNTYTFVAGVSTEELTQRIHYENKDQPIVITGLPPRPMVPEGMQNLLTEEALRRFIPYDNKNLARNFLSKGVRRHLQEIAGREPRPIQQPKKQLQSVEN
jgi:hypothetical protein